MNLIVAVDNNWGIGKDNKLLVSIPADMKYFRTQTKDSVVIMGRKTLESFPGGEPLKNRTNIVITKDENYKKDGVVIVHSVDDAVKVAKSYNKPIFVIGGASIYAQLLSFCDTAYITKISHSFDEPDSYFPNLDKMENWEVSEQSETEIYNGMFYKFVTYKQK